MSRWTGWRVKRTWIPIKSLNPVGELHEHRDKRQVEIACDNCRSLVLPPPDACVAVIAPNHHEPATSESSPMSIRVTIAHTQDDGGFAAIFLRFDGYPDRSGRDLERNHTWLDSVLMLVGDCDIRSLANGGMPERFTGSSCTVVMLTYAALHEFARNWGIEYGNDFDEDGLYCPEL